MKFTLNQKTVEYKGNPGRRLLDVLREDFGLTGTKEGCGEGECGACSVLLDDALVPACLTPVGEVAHREVMTIEGLQALPAYRVLEEAYGKAGAVQCGFCIPGMVMASYALLHRTPHPTQAQVRAGISGNLCRCTGYNTIVEAVLLAAEEGGNVW